MGEAYVKLTQEFSNLETEQLLIFPHQNFMPQEISGMRRTGVQEAFL